MGVFNLRSNVLAIFCAISLANPSIYSRNIAYRSVLLRFRSRIGQRPDQGLLRGLASCRDLEGGRMRRYLAFAEEGGDREAQATPKQLTLDPAREKAWRSVKKPLLRLGSSGIQDSHANSLLDLLSAHGLVKVKFNIYSKDEKLRDYANTLIDRAKKIRPSKFAEVQPMVFAEKEYQRVVMFSTPEAAGEALRTKS
ncbi:hypothetical protein AAMO2058_000951700 [Amorphochlora amoebiformis]